MRLPVSLVALRPTRGLEFAESSDALEGALNVAVRSGVISPDAHALRTWDLKIPDSFNDLVRRFLCTTAEYAWIVEEDIVVPQRAIEAMLAMDADVATINFNLKGGGPNRVSELRTDDGELYTLATGCMLIRREVFSVLSDPWFRTDISPGLRHPGSSTLKAFLDLVPSRFEYGGHDGFFTLSAIRAGLKVVSVPDLHCEHLKLDAMSAKDVNDGCHSISRVP